MTGIPNQGACVKCGAYLLTIEETRARLWAIGEVRDDPETAHGLEDDLHFDILRAIANSAITPSEAIEFSKLAIQTQEMGFSRWCA